MIAIAIAIALQLAPVPPATAIGYRDLPPAVVSVRVLAWADGQPPQPLESSADLALESHIARVECAAGAEVIVSFPRADGAYLLDGPFVCPSESGERRADPTWRRTVRVRAPPESTARGDVSWVSASRDAPDAWPRCIWMAAIAECWGVALDARGVLVFADDDRVAWSVIAAGVPAADFHNSAWGRLIVIGNAAGAGRVVATIARPMSAPERRTSLRLDTVAVSNALAVPVAGAVWVCGVQLPGSAWIELRSPRAGPNYLPLEEVARGPATLPLWVTLDEARQIRGIARGAQGNPAAGGVITLFRLLDPPAARPGSPDQPRRVFADERVADADGAFHFDALGDADYEVVAWHPQLGRGVAPIARADTSVIVSLGSAGQVRGRVIAGGRPAAGVDVISLPDPRAYADAADLTELKGGDSRTGADGRFVVSVAPGGGGEVRIGGGGHPIRRFPLPRVPLPIVDLGDIELGSPIDVSVALDRDPGCDIRATGPVGRSGLQVIAGTRAGPGLFRIVFPEEGVWEVQLLCGRDERALAPGLVSITQATRGTEVRLVVR